MEVFASLTSLSAQEKLRVRRCVRAAAAHRQRAWLSGPRFWFWIGMISGAGLATALLYVLGPAAGARRATWIAPAVTVGAFVLLFGPLVLLNHRARRITFRELLLAFCAWPGLVVALAIAWWTWYWRHHLTTFWWDFLVLPGGYLAALVAVGWACLVVTLPALMLEGWWADWRLNRARPDLRIVDRLVWLLFTIETRERGWGQVGLQARLVDLLEDIALLLEHFRPARLRAGDPTTDAWLRQESVRLAQSFRELKKWVCMPRDGTRRDLLHRLAQSLLCAATGNWDALERLDMSASVAPKWYSRVWHASCALGIAVLPLGALVALRAVGLGFSTGLHDVAVVAALLWLVVSALLWLDPSFRAKTEALRSLSEFIPWFGRKSP
jgi:hypothetical protein